MEETGLAAADAAAAVADPASDDLVAALLPRCSFPEPAPREAPEPLPLAVSGGADSLALLVLAAYSGRQAVAIHVDHGIRGGSAAEAHIVAAAAARYGLGFESRTVDVAAGPDLEARARRARYEALPSGVLTGHTMDDQAETVVLALLRGAALDGLAGMQPDRYSGPVGTVGTAAAATDRPRRPLLGLRRWETAALCAAQGLMPVVDPSNGDPRFRRNRVRAEVLPLLCEVAGRDLVPVLARQAGLMADDARLLESLSAAIDATDARRVARAPVPLARRAIRRWLRSTPAGGDPECHPPSAAEVARVLAVASGTIRACELAGGRRVERHAGKLRVAAKVCEP
jgi:tRNA(Ile)-lysidine synthase